jgi:nuclear pore complex protein Nup160
LFELVLHRSYRLSAAQERGTPIAELHAILYANVFTHCLLPAKKDYDLAYDAMMKNPDPERQNNCLRRFVVVCCENNEVRRLCDLPFELPSAAPPLADGQEASSSSLLEEVDRILYEKASRLDIAQLKPNYYQILYAFHMRRGVFRPGNSIGSVCTLR